MVMDRVEGLGWLGEQVEAAGRDLLAEMLKAVVIATAVNGQGKREILGFDAITSEDEAGWRVFLRSLGERGLSGVKLVISDDHKGLRTALASESPGSSTPRST